jgi:hypothetical protein
VIVFVLIKLVVQATCLLPPPHQEDHHEDEQNDHQDGQVDLLLSLIDDSKQIISGTRSVWTTRLDTMTIAVND